MRNRRHRAGPAARAVVLAVMAGFVACQGRTIPPPPPAAPAQPAIPDTQPAVDAPLFIGQSAFAAPMADQVDFAPVLAGSRADGANSGVTDGPAPLGRAPVTGSAQLALRPPMLWDHQGDLTAGCTMVLDPGLSKNCLAAVDAATLATQARWLPPGQDLNLATAVVDDAQEILVTTRQGHLFVVARPDGNTALFRLVRDVDLGAYLRPDQGLLGAVADDAGNLWFSSGGPPASGASGPDTVVGYVTRSDQVVTVAVVNQRAVAGFAVDQGSVFLATEPSAATDHTGFLYDLTAAAGQVETVWREPYDAGSLVKAGAVNRGTSSPVLLLGSQYVAITDNADDQAHLLVYLRGAASTAGVAAGAGDPRLVCTVGLFSPGASAVTSAPVAYSGPSGASVIVANGLNAPPPLAAPSDSGPANDLEQMAAGLTRVDVASDGSGCQTAWTAPLRVESSPELATTTGLIYGYTQDEGRAAAGTYIWYFVAVDYQTGRVVWRQRVGAGSSKNSDRQPLSVGANGVLYQSVPLGLVWMRDVAQKP